MTRFIVILCSFLIAFSEVNAQDTGDSSSVKDLDLVVVTATRTERKLGNVAVPVQLISQKQIRNAGSLRLNDILSEQSGLYITSSGATSAAGGGVFGNGVQVQGLSPDYTLILIDGEPVIGRQGGVIDLSRITVQNIKRIEIVKGPSSSLYGSEAMGGVVNIITEKSLTNTAGAGFRYGRFGSTDANLNAAFRKNRWTVQAFGNRNSSMGYDLDKSQPGKTVDPFVNYTGQLKVNYRLTPKTSLSLAARYYVEDQENYFQTNDITTGSTISITGKGVINDGSLNPVITHHFNNKARTALRLYHSRYQYEQDLVRESDKSPYYYDFFRQDFYRAENQSDFMIGELHYVSAGAGVVREELTTTRYEGKRNNNNQYFFLQDEWQLLRRLKLVGGFRYDHNSSYRSRLSPKLAVQYSVSEKISLTGSYGAGFKAPDFRQMFLNFLNTAAGGYVIYGANEITIDEIERQQAEGIITEILPRAYSLSQLHPEISNGLNLGAKGKLSERISFDLNFFRNDISNLIQVDVIAYRSNGAPVYSYFNVRRAFTQGAEANAGYKLNKDFTITGGYQFLMTADKDDLVRIREGSVFTRDEQTNESFRVSRSDYAGLPNRSAHMANLKLIYENEKGWSGSVRAIYKSRWGTTDRDGNALINRNDEFAPGFAMINLAIARELRGLRLQAGVDNLFNYKDRVNLPGQPGIQPYVSISYSFINKK